MPILILALILALPATLIIRAALLNLDTPLAFRPFVAQYRAADRRQAIGRCENVFTGSSVMKFWASLEQDLAPHPALNRAIPGTKINEVTHYVDDLVNRYSPSRVFLYAGSNDIQGGRPRSAEQVLAGFARFVAQVRRHGGATQIYYVSIIPSPARMRIRHRATVERANRLIEAFCRAGEDLHYIDLASDFVDAAGDPRPQLFRPDGVHLTDEAYGIWRRRIAGILGEA